MVLKRKLVLQRVGVSEGVATGTGVLTTNAISFLELDSTDTKIVGGNLDLLHLPIDEYDLSTLVVVADEALDLLMLTICQVGLDLSERIVPNVATEPELQ